MRRIGAGAWLFLALLCSLGLGDAQAGRGFRLELWPTYLGPDDIAPLSVFLAEVERTVPARVQAELPQRFLVSFDLQPEESAPPGLRHQVRVPSCPMDEPGHPGLAAPSRPQELAFLDVLGDGQGPQRIHLHRGFAAIIRAGPASAQRYPCGHRSLYRLAAATVLHEVMHAYDAKAGLSRDPRYRHLLRFERQGILRRMASRNELWARSPDPYEGHSLPESLAVNAEYFLLDPEYRCRRPASYTFLEEALRYRPFPAAGCQPNYAVYHRGEALSIDPERIYQVHYLLAARGAGIASRFGHSMFRLVVCNESRQTVGPECMDDVQDHVVIGFGANLGGDLQISPWKGLTGGYVSQLFVKPLSTVLIEYTEHELRGLHSLPLRLSPDEQRQLLRRALEIYWSYSGRYYFLSNNCASESLSLLQSASAHPGLQRIRAISPTGLRDELMRYGMIDLPRFPEGAAGQLAREAAGLYFPSQASRYEAAFAAIRPHLPPTAPATLRRYLDRTDARQRQAWQVGLAQLPDAQARILSAQAFALEGLILQLRFAAAERKLTRFVLQNFDRPLLHNLQALLPQLGIERPWQLAQGGYGVPLPQEVRRPPDRDHDIVAQKLWREAQALLQTYFPSEFIEWQGTQSNRRALLEQLLRGAHSPPDRTPLLAAQVR